MGKPTRSTKLLKRRKSIKSSVLSKMKRKTKGGNYFSGLLKAGDDTTDDGTKGTDTTPTANVKGTVDTMETDNNNTTTTTNYETNMNNGTEGDANTNAGTVGDANNTPVTGDTETKEDPYSGLLGMLKNPEKKLVEEKEEGGAKKKKKASKKKSSKKKKSKSKRKTSKKKKAKK